LTYDLRSGPLNYVAEQVEVFWRRRSRVVYGLMIPRECKLLQMREVLAEEHGLPLECQKVVKLSWRQVREGALLREKALGKGVGKRRWET
jgi:hypothetical protein